MTGKASSFDTFTPARDVAPLFADAHHARIICLPSGRQLYMACSGMDADGELEDIVSVLAALDLDEKILQPFREAAEVGERVRNSVRAIRDLLPDTLQPGDLDDTLVELGLHAASRRLNWAAFAALLED